MNRNTLYYKVYSQVMVRTTAKTVSIFHYITHTWANQVIQMKSIYIALAVSVGGWLALLFWTYDGLTWLEHVTVQTCLAHSQGMTKKRKDQSPVLPFKGMAHTS